MLFATWINIDNICLSLFLNCFRQHWFRVCRSCWGLVDDHCHHKCCCYCFLSCYMFYIYMYVTLHIFIYSYAGCITSFSRHACGKHLYPPKMFSVLNNLKSSSIVLKCQRKVHFMFGICSFTIWSCVYPVLSVWLFMQSAF